MGKISVFGDQSGKDDLVAKVSHWKGFSSYRHHLTEKPKTYRYYDYGQFQKDGEKRPIADYLRTIDLLIDPLPHMKDMAPAERQRIIREAVAEREAQFAAQRREKVLNGARSSDKVVGMRKVYKLNPRDRAESKRTRGPKPICYTQDPVLEANYIIFQRNILRVFRRALVVYRMGFWGYAEFPRGSLRPPLIEVVG